MRPFFIRPIQQLTARAETGDVEAQYDLGLHYWLGVGVAKYRAEGVRWFRKAAEQGDVGAQYALGVAYWFGDGVPVNYIEAYAWLSLAKAGGYEDADEALHTLSLKMTRAQIAAAQDRALEFHIEIEARRAQD